MKRLRYLILVISVFLLLGCSLNNNKEKDNNNNKPDDNKVELIEVKYNDSIKAIKDDCTSTPVLLFEMADYKVYTQCVKSINLKGDILGESNINDFIKELNNISEDNILTYKDGGTKLYKGKDMNVIVCNKLLSLELTNRDIYFGDSTLILKSNYCRSNNNSETMIFKVESISGNELTVSRDNEEPTTVYYEYDYELEKGKKYEFEFMFNENIIVNKNNIKDIFAMGTIIDIREVK